MGQQIKELRDWRGQLTMEAAAALVVVDGKPTNRATWHAWEWGRKRPGPRHMPVLLEVTGLSADIFFRPANSDATAPLTLAV